MIITLCNTRSNANVSANSWMSILYRYFETTADPEIEVLVLLLYYPIAALKLLGYATSPKMCNEKKCAPISHARQLDAIQPL